MTASTSPAAEQLARTASVPAGRMRAIVQTAYGDAHVLSLGDVPRPVIGPAEVLVEVRAAGLSRSTWHLMTGRPYAMRLAGFGVRAPKNTVLAGDIAGVVTAIGADVTRFRVGDEVFGEGSSGFAEFSAAAENRLAHKPASLTFVQAAAVPVSGVTALHGLTDVGRLQAGQRVLVTGASGGVGSFAVQIAKSLGAQVTGVSSTRKVALVRSLGADHVIDYTTQDFADSGTTYDLILDVAGNASLSRLRRALTARGTVVITGGETSGRLLGGADRQLRALALSPVVPQRLTTFVGKVNATHLERLTALIEAGGVVPAIERTFPLDEMPAAMRHLTAGKARGKLVITI